ncbi:MAG: 3-phosphoshikimate 1-carboxyvinyltransferase [Pseudomonadota bacterium]
MPCARVDFVVLPANRPLGGVVSTPGDKSIGHRALIVGALGEGACCIAGLSNGADNLRTIEALRGLGVEIEQKPEGVIVHGVGLSGFRAPTAPLDCGNSATSMRLLAGVLAAQPFRATLVGDDSLGRRPMRRIVAPLTTMGASLHGRPGKNPDEEYPPLTIAGGRLSGCCHRLPFASGQVKSALLLAGIFADGPTEIHEPFRSRDHTERLLAHLGAPLTMTATASATDPQRLRRTFGHGIRTVSVRIDPRGWDRRLRLRFLTVPGDPSSAAFVLAAALLVGTSEEGVLIEGVCVNHTRTGFLDAVTRMGAQVSLENQRVMAGEPVADVLVVGGPAKLRAIAVEGEAVVRTVDEIPILAVLAAKASGCTVIRDAEELRVKESDRVATTVRMLRSFGVTVEENADGLAIDGQPGCLFSAGEVDSAGDHRIAMAAAVAALGGSGTTIVRSVANVATSFPAFAAVMGQLGAQITAVLV